MNESSDCQSEQNRKDSKGVDKLINELEQLTGKYVAESEKFYRSMYEKAAQARATDNAAVSLRSKCDLPKLANKETCERQIDQYLERLKRLSCELNALSASEQALIFLDHLEIYRQKTIDFCRSTRKIFSISKPSDNSKEFGHILELFRGLKTKLDELQDRNPISGSSGIQNVEVLQELIANIQLLFDRHFKQSELETIDFDQLIDETAKCVSQSEMGAKDEHDDQKASTKKEIVFKLNLIIERARISLKTFEDELLKCQNDELSAFVEKAAKTIEELEGSFRFDLQTVNHEDAQFNSFLRAISSSVESFVSKVHYLINDSLEKSFYEQCDLNEELVANLSKLAGTVLIKRLAQDRRYDGPKDPKLDMRKLDTRRRSESFRENELQRRLENLKMPRKERYTKESDLMFKTTDLIAVVNKQKQRQNATQNVATEEDTNDGLFKFKINKGKKINFPSIYQISVSGSKHSRTNKSNEMDEVKEQLSKLITSTKKSTSLASDRRAENLESAKKKIQKMFKPDKKDGRKDSKRSERKGK